jgi:heptosyltransferase-2
MHVAAALSNKNGKENSKETAHKKLIAIFGSSDPYHTPPMHPQAVIEYLALDCSPCFKRVCPLQKSSEKLKCLKKIKPSHIISKLN